MEIIQGRKKDSQRERVRMGAISSRLVGDDDKHFFLCELLNLSRAQALVSFDKQKRIPRSEPKAKKKRSSLSSLFFSFSSLPCLPRPGR